MDKIKDFQKQNRQEQIRRLVSERIRKDGYSLADFKKEYYPSDLDCKEFEQIRNEISIKAHN